VLLSDEGGKAAALTDYHAFKAQSEGEKK